MRLAGRLLVAFVLLGAVFGLCVHYAENAGAHDPYPSNEELVTNYDAHVGEETMVFGTVLEVNDDAGTATIEVDSNVGPFEMTVREFSVSGSVQPGGAVQVYGTAAPKRANAPKRVIDAKNVAVVNPSGSSDLYKYAVSAVGAVLVLVLFFRQWRFDAAALAFEVRDDG